MLYVNQSSKFFKKMQRNKSLNKISVNKTKTKNPSTYAVKRQTKNQKKNFKSHLINNLCQEYTQNSQNSII